MCVCVCVSVCVCINVYRLHSYYIKFSYIKKNLRMKYVSKTVEEKNLSMQNISCISQKSMSVYIQ